MLAYPAASNIGPSFERSAAGNPPKTPVKKRKKVYAVRQHTVDQHELPLVLRGNIVMRTKYSVKT